MTPIILISIGIIASAMISLIAHNTSLETGVETLIIYSTYYIIFSIQHYLTPIRFREK